MKERMKFVDRMRHELDEWEAKLEPLKVKAKLGEMEARERFDALDKTVTAATRPIRSKLKELTNESGEAWDDLAGGCERAWGEAKTAIKSAIARYTG